MMPIPVIDIDAEIQQFMHQLPPLSYGNILSFEVYKIDDPLGLLTQRMLLCIDKSGVRLKYLATNYI